MMPVDEMTLQDIEAELRGYPTKLHFMYDVDQGRFGLTDPPSDLKKQSPGKDARKAKGTATTMNQPETMSERELKAKEAEEPIMGRLLDNCPDATDELWGGPYPLSVGNVPPTQVKIWFNTVADQLMVWNWKTPAWQPVSLTVAVGATPPTVIGQLYVDQNQKLWVFVDDLCELTVPIPGRPTATDGAAFTASADPPLNPATGTLWFVPRSQDLSIWNGFVWVKIGKRVRRNVRTGNYAGTWNAGGNRSQATAAGGILYLSGIRGIDPLTQKQLPGPGPGNTQGTVAPNTAPNANARIIQIYQNIKTIVEAEGLSLFDCTGLVTSVTSAAYIGPTAILEALPQFWGNGPYPPRTHQVWLQMSGSDVEAEFPDVPNWPPRGDVAEVQATFWMGGAGPKNPTAMSEAVREIPGVSVSEVPLGSVEEPG